MKYVGKTNNSKRVSKPDAFRLHSQSLWFSLKGDAQSLRNENAEIRHFDFVVCYISPSHMVIG